MSALVETRRFVRANAKLFREPSPVYVSVASLPLILFVIGARVSDVTSANPVPITNEIVDHWKDASDMWALEMTAAFRVCSVTVPLTYCIETPSLEHCIVFPIMRKTISAQISHQLMQK